MEGWYDSSEVGLGCILPDLTDHDIDEVTKDIIVILIIIVCKLSLNSDSSSRHQKQFAPSLEKAVNLLRCVYTYMYSVHSFIIIREVLILTLSIFIPL